MTLDFTFLKKEQIWGEDSLDVIKKYGTKVAPTDLALLLGCYVTSRSGRTSENDLACDSWSASLDRYLGIYKRVCYVNSWEGKEDWMFYLCSRNIAARPALPPSEVSKIKPKEVRTLKSGARIVEYGEYPQTVADKRISRALERLYKLHSLHPTGKKYTFDSVDPREYYGENRSFKAISYPEYRLDGKKYIRVPGWSSYADNWVSNGERVESPKDYWVEVQPIEWLMDKSGWMVAKKCLFAGVQFNGIRKEDDYNFSKTSIKRYLDTYFAKEMMPIERVAKHSKTKIGKIALKKRQVTR